MPGKDQYTKKGPLFGNNRSHALNRTNRKYDLNLQKVTIKEDGKVKTLRVTAKTMRTLKKQGKLA